MGHECTGLRHTRKGHRSNYFEWDIKHLNGLVYELFSITKFLSTLEYAIHIDIEILNLPPHISKVANVKMSLYGCLDITSQTTAQIVLL